MEAFRELLLEDGAIVPDISNIMSVIVTIVHYSGRKDNFIQMWCTCTGINRLDKETLLTCN